MNHIRLLISALMALPIFTILVLVLPNLNASDLARYPADDLMTHAEATSISDVMAAPESEWRPARDRPLFAIDLSPRELWRRIRLPPAIGVTPEQMVLQIGFPLISEVEFYLVEGGSVIKTLATGMDRPSLPGQLKSARIMFSLDRHPSAMRTIYIRIGPGLPFFYPTVLRTASRETYVCWIQNLVRGVFCGFLFGLLVYSLVIYIYLRQKMHLDFAAFLLSNLVLCGLLSETILDATGISQKGFDASIRVILVACFAIVGCYVNFIRSCLSLNRNDPQFDLSMRLILLANALTVPMVYLVSPGIGLLLLLATVLILSVTTSIAYLRVIQIPGQLNLITTLLGGPMASSIQIFAAHITIQTAIGMDGLIVFGATWGSLFLAVNMAHLTREIRERTRLLKNAIDQSVPLTAINSSLDNSHTGLFASNTLEVTIIFVDMASFSKISERHDAPTVFEELSRRFEEITSIITDHGGKIDRSLGDGVLGFFGSNPGLINTRSHILDAYRAARKIQELYRDEMYKSYLNNERRILLPVRIGIHTDKVTIGNMGSSLQIDFTLVGNGVNFANRLETACAAFRIMVSQSTYDGLIRLGVDAKGFESIMIAVKHQEELVRAYEINPHVAHMDHLALLTQHFRESLGETRRDSRWMLKNPAILSVTSAYGPMQVKDFSHNGLLLSADIYLAPKASIVLKIETQNQEINHRLQKHFLDTVEVEVRWSCRRGLDYVHGVRFVGGHPEQWEFLVGLIAELNGQAGEQAA